MNIDAEKIQLARKVLETDDPGIISSIKEIFQEEDSTDFYDELTIDQQQEIDEAILEIEQGKSSDFYSFLKKHKK